MSNLTLPKLYFPTTHEFGSVASGHKNLLRDARLRKQLGIVTAIAGGDRGYNTEGDVITQTVDGVQLNNIWAEFQQTLAIQNSQRNTLVSFLTYNVNEPIVTVPQFGGGEDFEIASEFGVPKSVRPTSSYFQMGFDFEWYDVATRFTWKFLAEATAAQVEAVHQSVLEADNRLVFNEIMRTLFRNTNREVDIQNRAYNVYAFYNADGTVPPTYRTNTFDGTHNHYLTSGAATVTSGDLDDVFNHLEHHGYSRQNGAEIVLMVNRAEGDVIRTFRTSLTGGTAKFDFIPATNTATFLLPNTFITSTVDGGRPSNSLRGMTVIGSYGDMLIVQEDYIPAGYMVAFATGGQESLTNPIGIREHARQELRGLRIVKGREPDYPLQDSYYQRGFGTGIRQRGAGVVMQITANASYTIPAQYA
jgi:hypothetical protein